ncbi:ubiquitin-specific protease doa4 [Mucor velutinosus]|uniref:Ubiquitin-specific protease doa4 n=1 Tax=Mucor velutinosus TaxID=708070 RepID=A0AAN7D9P6_9FUNG|nr:ubiquitin-specific protease doa4 [Mucor velutinosus]
MQNKLYSFGFNAFGQTKESDEAIIRFPYCHTHTSRVLFTSWETTIVIDDEGVLQFWGFQPPWLSAFKKLCQQKRNIISVFGDPNSMMGLIDEQHTLSYVTETSEHMDCMTHIEQAAYCQGQRAIFVLKQESGQVEQHNINTLNSEKLDLPPGCKITKMSAAHTHILLLTDSLDAPVLAFGSNRLSQCGIDYQQQELKTPTAIDYFCGLRDATDVACGPFHSAVILGGDVYTFGWSKDGRLGWGSTKQDDDIISLAVFLDVNDQPIEINATKIACGSAHTLVLDDHGHVWSCGSNAYGQLGRTPPANQQSDTHFRRCSTDTAMDCFAGRWASFILI